MLMYLVAGIIAGLTYMFLQRFFLPPAVALEPSKWQQFKLSERIEVSHDTFIFRFALRDAKQKLGLPIGQHIVLRAMCDNGEGKMEMVQHSYTPISSDDDLGHVDFMIKVYFPNVHPKFPHGGRLSQHLHALKVGESMEMRGPQGKFDYRGHGLARINRTGKEWVNEQVDAYAMVAGGTGITPMLQLIRAIHKNKEDKTKVYLVYGNQTEKDILLRKELDELVADDPERIHVWYTIDREPSPQWKYDVGYVSEEMFRKHLPIVSSLGDPSVPQNAGIKKVMGLMCGPPPMVQFAIKPNLEKLGYVPSELFAF